MTDKIATITDEKPIRRFFLLHLKPATLPEACLKFTHTFGLGGCSAVLFGLLVGSGMLLTLVYRAAPETAYRATQSLYTQYQFGGLVRNVHNLSADALFAVVILHMLRVFYTGAYHGVRRFNWVVGVLLLMGILSAGFTGYLLPWDQTAFWAVTISTAMLSYIPVAGESLQTLLRGGMEMGPSTLVLYYSLHTSFIPVGLTLLMGYHFWRIRKAKGVILPFPQDRTESEAVSRVPVHPHLLLRELSMALMVTAAIFITAVFVDAPLGPAADAGASPNPSKAAWYFMAFQELQLHFHPFWVVCVLPLLLIAALIAVPYAKYDEALSGPWFLSRKGRRIVAASALQALLLVPMLVISDDLFFRPEGGMPSFFGRGLLPTAAIVGTLFVLWRLLVKHFAAKKQEATMAVFTMVLVSLVVLTVIGVWFRGAGMALSLPWTMN